MSTPAGQCNHCAAPIRWMTTQTGKHMPVDAEPDAERGNVVRRRRKGVRDNWSSTAKMRAFIVAESCLKQLVKPCASIKDEKGGYVGADHVDGCACSPYRVAYDIGRAKYTDTVHPDDCARCGPPGKPAPAGSPRSAKHQHQMAIRLATKKLLRDLWREASRLHGASS